jgi:hypothetical protein
MERPAPAVVRMSVRRNAHPGRFYTSLGNNMQSTLHTVNRAVADQCYARSIEASNRNRHNGDIFAVSASKRWPHSSRSKGRLVCVSIRSPGYLNPRKDVVRDSCQPELQRRDLLFWSHVLELLLESLLGWQDL